MPLTEIGCNSSDLIELRARKRKQQVESTSKQSLSQENISDEKCENNANILFENLF
ncbi:18405_t:CDS:1, partial [Dentiscutata erythropus]